MIKIFYNDRILAFSESVNPDFQFANVLHFDDKTELAIKLFLNSSNEYNLLIIGVSDAVAMSLLKKVFRVIEAGGGRVHDSQGRTLCIFRSGRWDLPKGWLEKGETLDQCAVREVCEECGLNAADIVNEGKLITTYHIYPFKDAFALKVTHWYRMKYTGIGTTKPQTEEDITEVKWVSESEMEAVKRNTYGNIRMVLER
ncbi:MAG: NUDIX domain-containing protein [Bacteroidales bacterium]|nr:NUDIX domain-containing protein [Bacteroidales bacterium]MBO7572727.1 NUDIX domain-containing protein [Bacteroidales bacterium]